ncbi:MAG: helix-turn-helix transcriptional regulator [bacterium]|nr:helix-turn-helix transcriptional regulator [bacterium]
MKPKTNNDEFAAVQERLSMVFGDVDQQSRDFGKRFLRFRLKLKKSREEFEAETGYPATYIAGVENGKFIPTIQFVEHFYDHYNLNITWLVKGKLPMICR